MLGQGKTGPLLRPIGPPPLQNCPAPSPRVGFAAPSLNLCEAYLPQANSRTAKRIAPARGNSEAQCEAYLPQANSRTAKRIAPARGNSEAPKNIPQRKPTPIGEWRRIARLRAGRNVGVEISHKIQCVT